MRVIKYLNKATTAKTQYREISKENERWILDSCKQIVKWVDELKQCENQTEEVQDAIMELTARRSRMPKRSQEYGGGYNSVYTMCEGTVENFKHGQYNLSSKTMKGLEEAFKIANRVSNGEIDEVWFDESNTLKDENTKPITRTTYSDLFEILIPKLKK